MTTINTIEDLIRLLRTNPEYAESLRAILLTRELIELPEKFAQHARDMDSRFEQVDARFEQIDARFEQIDARFQQIDVRFQHLETRMDRVENSLGVLRGAHARNATREETGFIARTLGLRAVRNLSTEDLYQIAQSADTSGLPANGLTSFYHADLVFEAEDDRNNPAFVAIEISYTVDSHDTQRAIRNAAWLEMFTGHRAIAVVTGLMKHSSADADIDAGRVSWYEIPSALLRSE